MIEFGMSKPSISKPHSSLTENDIGPRNVSSPRTLTHALAVSSNACATGKSLMLSKKPKKPTRSL